MTLDYWLKGTDEQRDALKAVAQENNLANFEAQNFFRTPNLTSYTLHDTLSDFELYLSKYGGSLRREENKKAVEGILINILVSLDPSVASIIQDAFYFTDRSNDARYDPIPHQKPLQIAYLPKGITDFSTDRFNDAVELNLDLSAQFQRELINENALDPTLSDASPDKTLTVKVCTPKADHNILHVYINKRGIQTIRRVIYKSLAYYIANSEILHERIIQQGGEELLDVILGLSHDLFVDREHGLEHILDYLPDYLNKRTEEQRKNIIPEFSKIKQETLNRSRLNNIKEVFDLAKDRLERNLTEFSSLKQNYVSAKFELDNYKDIPYNAIEVFLTKINEDPGLVNLDYTGNNKDIAFIITGPLLHTDGETWSKYLSNNYSNIYEFIQSYAITHYENFLTDTEKLQKAITTLFERTLISKEILLHTTVKLGISSHSDVLNITKYNLFDTDYFPQPHIGGDLTCWGEAKKLIEQNLLDNDGETAYLQLKYAIQQMTASDTAVANRLTLSILDKTYEDIPVYLDTKTNQFKTFKTLIKEILDENNKTNA